MKYGNIICDPASKEAKALIGKTVIASNIFTGIITPECFRKGTLLKIDKGDSCPFKVEDSGTSFEYTFIREVIEEAPKYRPYKDYEEMVSDYCERFGVVKTEYSMPMIWLTTPSGGAFLVDTFCPTGEHIKLFDGLERMDEIFENLTYLDGSTVGKKEEEE